MATIYKPIITRIDTTANWTTLNPVPANGEQCIEILGGGLFKLKIGDGVSPWIALNYYQGSSGSAEDLSKLITPDKSSLVAAINSVQKQVNDLATALINLSDVARTGDYNDLINKLIAGDGIRIDENNVISTTGGPTPPTPIDEYDPSTENLEIHSIVIVSDEDGDLVLDGVNGEIIPIYDEDGHEIDIDGNIIYDGDIEVVSDTDSNLVLDNVDGQIIPADIEEESSDVIYNDGDVTVSNLNVVSDTDGNVVLENSNIEPGE